MQRGSRLILLVGFFSLVFASLAEGQIRLPPDPSKVTKRNLGENGGSSTSAGASLVPSQSRTVVVQYVAVTPVEAWSNAAGNVMQARLLAFSAPTTGETGPVEIIREGKVRFLVTGRKDPVEYPLDQLGESEKARIQALAAVAAKGPPK